MTDGMIKLFDDTFNENKALKKRITELEDTLQNIADTTYDGQSKWLAKNVLGGEKS